MALRQEFSDVKGLSTAATRAEAFRGLGLELVSVSPDALKLSEDFRKIMGGDADLVGAVDRAARNFADDAAFKAGEFRDSGDMTVLAGFVGHSAAVAALNAQHVAKEKEKKREEAANFEAQLKALQDEIAALEAQIKGLEDDIERYSRELSKLARQIKAVDQVIELLVANELDPVKHKALLAEAGLDADVTLEDALAFKGKLTGQKVEVENRKTDAERDVEEARRQIQEKKAIIAEHEGSKARFSSKTDIALNANHALAATVVFNSEVNTIETEIAEKKMSTDDQVTSFIKDVRAAQSSLEGKALYLREKELFDTLTKDAKLSIAYADVDDSVLKLFDEDYFTLPNITTSIQSAMAPS